MRLESLVVVALLSTLAPRFASAQKLADLNASSSVGTSVVDSTALAPMLITASATKHASRWPYILVGTAVGIGVAAIDINANKTGSELDAIAVPPTVLVYALLGAGTGWIVYHFRHRHDGE